MIQYKNEQGRIAYQPEINGKRLWRVPPVVHWYPERRYWAYGNQSGDEPVLCSKRKALKIERQEREHKATIFKEAS